MHIYIGKLKSLHKNQFNGTGYPRMKCIKWQLLKLLNRVNETINCIHVIIEMLNSIGRKGHKINNSIFTEDDELLQSGGNIADMWWNDKKKKSWEKGNEKWSFAFLNLQAHVRMYSLKSHLWVEYEPLVHIINMVFICRRSMCVWMCISPSDHI